jgi:hypothetical protein
LPAAHLLNQGHDPPSCFVTCHASDVDVGDEIALGVGVARARSIREIRRQTLRRCQTGTLANEQNDHFRIENVTDVVENAHATMADKKWTTKTPATLKCLVVKQGQKTGHLRRDRCGGQPIADGDLERASGGTLAAQRFAARIVQPSAKIGAQQVFFFRLGVRVDLERLESPNEFITEITFQLNFRMNRVESGGMILTQLQLCHRSI